MDKYYIAFSSIEQLDSRFVQRLFNYFGCIEKAFNADLKELSQIDELSVKRTETFLKLRDKVDIDKCFSEVINRGLKYITFENDEYPYLLKQISNPPMMFYYKGDLKSCNLDRTIAVVGSRRASTNAKDTLTKIILELQNTDITIVSGLATGIDTTAHKSAIDAGLKTIGVIASGFDFVYPTNNRDLYSKLENGHGAILSEYYPTLGPMPFRFPHRNRIVSGLSYGALIAEAALKSGAMITANLCLEQGRELMCIPGLVSNPNTQGIYKLLKNGASMVTCAEDIYEAMGWEVKQASAAQLNLKQFSPDEQAILSAIEIEPKGFDLISEETQIKFEDLLVCLTGLELSGVIKQIDGEKYKTI